MLLHGWAIKRYKRMPIQSLEDLYSPAMHVATCVVASTKSFVQLVSRRGYNIASRLVCHRRVVHYRSNIFEGNTYWVDGWFEVKIVPCVVTQNLYQVGALQLAHMGLASLADAVRRLSALPCLLFCGRSDVLPCLSVNESQRRSSSVSTFISDIDLPRSTACAPVVQCDYALHCFCRLSGHCECYFPSGQSRLSTSVSEAVVVCRCLDKPVGTLLCKSVTRHVSVC